MARGLRGMPVVLWPAYILLMINSMLCMKLFEGHIESLALSPVLRLSLFFVTGLAISWIIIFGPVYILYRYKVGSNRSFWIDLPLILLGEAPGIHSILYYGLLGVSCAGLIILDIHFWHRV